MLSALDKIAWKDFHLPVIYMSQTFKENEAVGSLETQAILSSVLSDSIHIHCLSPAQMNDYYLYHGTAPRAQQKGLVAGTG